MLRVLNRRILNPSSLLRPCLISNLVISSSISSSSSGVRFRRALTLLPFAARFSSKPGHLGHHDLGGTGDSSSTSASFDDHEPLKDWEQKVDALYQLLAVNSDFLSVHRLRRGIEMLPEAAVGWPYYARWAASMAGALVESGHLKLQALEPSDALRPSNVEAEFQPGAIVQVRDEDAISVWRKPHLRTPGYLFGAVGEIVSCEGLFDSPDNEAFRALFSEKHEPVKQWLYRVRFHQKRLWPEYDGSDEDTIVVEVYEPWLKHERDPHHQYNHGKPREPNFIVRRQQHHDSHPAEEHQQQHNHEKKRRHHGNKERHHHKHENPIEVEKRAVEEEGVPELGAEFAERFVSAVLEAGLVEAAELRGMIRHRSQRTYALGAEVCVRAWTDKSFRKALLDDPISALKNEFDIDWDPHTKLVVLQQGNGVHHLVVCTLCSCYPTILLGAPPAYYKSAHYRALAVRTPRKLLAESFGLFVTEPRIEVVDSTADCRYFLIPTPPPNVESKSKEELLAMINCDTMIGTALIDQ